MAEGTPYNRRTLIKGIAVGTGLAAKSSSQILQTRSGKNRPNILYLHSHDTGRYTEAYGHDVPTPNLQKLAREGILFRQAFSAAPTCSPSRAALLTGQCAHSSGMLGLAHRGFSLKDYRQHLVHTLRDAGYVSVLAGLQHVAKTPDAIGYDRILEAKTKTAAHVAPAAVSFLKDAPRQPFFLDVGFFETHRIFHEPGPQEDARYSRPPVTVPDAPRSRQDMAGFKASARVLDRAVGAVLTALETAGLAENTLVICTTDHGVPFPGAKCNLTQHGTGVMLTMRGPGVFTGGKTCDALVSQIDLFPTICDLLEVRPPDWLQGHSILPLLRGERPEINDHVFAEVTYHAAYEPKRSIRTHRFNYIRNFGSRRTPVLPNCDDSPSKSLWLEAGWRQRPVPVEELYDVVFDPNETHNLADDPDHASVRNEMRSLLEQWMTKTGDPLLKGGVPAPRGAEVNDPDGTSPQEPTTKVS